MVIKLMSTTRTSWDTIIALVHDSSPDASIKAVAVAQLTRLQMYVIYPPANRQLWPVPAAVAAVYSESDADAAAGTGPRCGDDDALKEEDIEAHSALLSSFFSWRLFDVQVLRIIRDYAAYAKDDLAQDKKRRWPALTAPRHSI
jgi:hypothetical protein